MDIENGAPRFRRRVLIRVGNFSINHVLVPSCWPVGAGHEKRKERPSSEGALFASGGGRLALVLRHLRPQRGGLP
jgi:hypothetical protein